MRADLTKLEETVNFILGPKPGHHDLLIERWPQLERNSERLNLNKPCLPSSHPPPSPLPLPGPSHPKDTGTPLGRVKEAVSRTSSHELVSGQASVVEELTKRDKDDKKKSI